MPLISTRGAASAQGFGEFAQSAAPVYIEDVFSTYLYTGNGSTQTITNGIDLSTKGGLVWTKIRSAADRNALIDSARGINKLLNSDGTFAQATQNNMITALTTTGYTLGTDGTGQTNLNTATYASWTFRKQPKFFDVVTYTGNGVFDRAIPHSLNGTVGFVVIKRTDTTSNWVAQHRSNPDKNQYILYLNDTGGYFNEGDSYFSRANCFTNTDIYVGNAAAVNANGGTYVMYVWAHNAGGFGLPGTDNVISCGSYIGNGATAGPVITLGYEPQWLLVKDVTATDGFGNWLMFDNMRGWPVGSNGQQLFANSSSSEGAADRFVPTATGFNVTNGYSQSNVNGNTYIYIAIRRGPMKVPTSGTSVYNGTTGIAGGTKVTTGFPVDMQLLKDGVSSTVSIRVVSRLTGVDTTDNNSDFQQAKFLLTAATDAEGSSGTITNAWDNTGFKVAPAYTTATMQWSFGRAPGFFDVVCYTGTGSARTVTHGLGVAPELMIVKTRSNADDWCVYHKNIGATGNLRLQLNIAAEYAITRWNNTSPTVNVFTVGTSDLVNLSAWTYVAYLFATCPGVSKVGSYTGSGTTKQIDCGFTAGARFVLIKRTDSTGSWYCWDSARGIVAGNDPYLLLNSTAAEVTGTDYIDTYSAGFEITSTAPAEINASGGTFVFLSIA